MGRSRHRQKKPESAKSFYAPTSIERIHHRIYHCEWIRRRTVYRILTRDRLVQHWLALHQIFTYSSTRYSNIALASRQESTICDIVRIVRSHTIHCLSDPNSVDMCRSHPFPSGNGSGVGDDGNREVGLRDRLPVRS